MKYLIATIILLSMAGCGGCSDRDCSAMANTLGVCQVGNVCSGITCQVDHHLEGCDCVEDVDDG